MSEIPSNRCIYWRGLLNTAHCAVQICCTEQNSIYLVRFQVLTAASMKIVFCDIARCSLEVNRRFRSAYYLYHQNDSDDVQMGFHINRPNDGFSTHLWNGGVLQRDYTAVCFRRQSSQDVHRSLAIEQVSRNGRAFQLYSRGKAKQSRYTPWRRLGGEEYSSYSFTTSALDEVSGQRHARRKDPRYPLEYSRGTCASGPLDVVLGFHGYIIIIIWLFSQIRALAFPLWGFLAITFLRGWIASPAPNLQPGGPGLRIYNHRGQGGPAIPPGTGYPF
jgi:hypothetical protein